MADKSEKLKKQIEALKDEVDELKKQLKENSENDERRHQEIKTLQEKQHGENLIWNKITGLGALATPTTILLTMLGRFLKKDKKVVENNREDKTKDNSSKTDLSGIAEIIREVKK